MSTQAHKLALITVTHLLQEKTNAIWDCNFAYLLFNRVVKQLISLIMLITRLIFLNRALTAVLMHILFVTSFNLFVFHLQVDEVDPLVER